jgi:hypothetical protein
MPMLDQAESLRRRHRKDAFHLAASHNRMNADDLEYDDTFNYLTKPTTRALNNATNNRTLLLAKTKAHLIQELAVTAGDVQTPRFVELLDQLTRYYDPTSFDARLPSSNNTNTKNSNQGLDSMWLTLSKPNYRGCLGRFCDADANGYLYSLGHMSMHMIPSQLICCIDGTFNPVHHVASKERRTLLPDVPKHLQSLVQSDKCALRSYE